MIRAPSGTDGRPRYPGWKIAREKSRHAGTPRVRAGQCSPNALLPRCENDFPPVRLDDQPPFPAHPFGHHRDKVEPELAHARAIAMLVDPLDASTTVPPGLISPRRRALPRI